MIHTVKGFGILVMGKCANPWHEGMDILMDERMVVLMAEGMVGITAEGLGELMSYGCEENKGLDFILGGSKITADGDCSHEIKRRLLLGRKVMANLDSIFKSSDITLSRKVCLVKAMVFPVCREPARDIPPMTRTSGEAWWARRVRSQGVLCLSICPETKICLFTVCYPILF